MFFFFFKQKTAYEMRISDWSSDVCSSDLHGGRLQGGDRRFLHGGPGQPPMQTGDEQGPEGADAGRLHRGGDAEEDDAKHQDDQRDTADRVEPQAKLPGEIDVFLDRQGRAERRVDVAADGDMYDIEAG